MFDNPFAMVVGIVLIVSITQLLKARYRFRQGLPVDDGHGHGHRRHRSDGRDTLPDQARPAALDAETQAEIRALKDRIAVLERIATDNHSARGLASEIEELRTR